MLVSSAFLGVATMVESCVHVGRLWMLVFILLLVVLQQSSTLLALPSKPNLELESRLIDGLGSLVVQGGSFGLSSVGVCSGEAGGFEGLSLD